jgi:cytochrome c-type biogenesis protein CcmH/NrfG
MRRNTSLALALLLAAPLAVSAQPPQITESMGYYRTPEQKAMDAYGRGMKLKKKAEAATEPAQQAKLYLKAKEELSKSAGYHVNYDAYLALGQVYLALGQQESALDACNHAQSLKPKDEAAKTCMTEAQTKIQEAAAAKPRDSGR